MMMAEVAGHKRRSPDGFLIDNSSSPLCIQNDQGSCGGGGAGDSTRFSGRSEKRLKIGGYGGGGGATISSKEKKDKIGERVSKLQQLVSPFGKSDTASVLHEATAYIKFLHDQLQVLSAPYLQTAETGKMEDGEYYSLRSRGLCLVPVESTLSIVQNNGADLWAPMNSSRN